MKREDIPQRLDCVRVMLRCRVTWRQLCALQAAGLFPLPAPGTNGNEYIAADIEQWDREHAMKTWNGICEGVFDSVTFRRRIPEILEAAAMRSRK